MIGILKCKSKNKYYKASKWVPLCCSYVNVGVLVTVMDVLNFNSMIHQVNFMIYV